jgi:16S rRNA processing protein RimM
MKNQHLECGKIINIHVVKGALKIEPWCDSPKVVADLKRIFIQSKDGSLAEKKVLRASVATRFVLMYLEGVENPDDARLYKNKVVFALREDIPLEEGDFFLADLIGLPVFDFDTGREYGKIKDADFDRHTPLYTIETEKGDVLFPAIDEFVKEIDIETGIKIRPIRGFFDEV